MKKILFSLAVIMSTSMSPLYADPSPEDIPFNYTTKLQGYVVGVTSLAVSPDRGFAKCYVAVLPNGHQEAYYDYSMTDEACATAKMAYAIGEKVYLWSYGKGNGKNAEIVALEINNDSKVLWRIPPSK